MSKRRRAKNRNRDHPPRASTTPTRVNVQPEQPDTRHEPAARDELIRNTWNTVRPLIIRRWPWIAGAALVVAVLLLGSALLHVGPLQNLFPAPLAFAAARAGESLIVVADLDNRSGGTYKGVDPAQFLYERLTAQARKDKLPVRVERLHRALDDNSAPQTRDAYDAALVLWGWYDARSINPRLERTAAPSTFDSVDEGRRFTLADPARLELSPVSDLSARSAYLVSLVLGLDAYSNPAAPRGAGLAYLTGALDSIPKDAASVTRPAEAYFFRGDIYARDQGEYDHAIADYDQALKLVPDWKEAFLNRGHAYLAQRNFARALSDYNQAVRVKPDWPAAYYNRGNAYSARGDYDRALADYGQALALKPDWEDVYLDRGLAYKGKGNYDRAIADYEQALRLKPDLAEAYLNRGNAYYAKGDYSRAIADSSQALQRKPDLAAAYINRGTAYYALRDYDHAIADFGASLKLKPDWVVAYTNRGLAYKAKGEKDRAIADFAKVLALTDDAILRQTAREQLQALGVQ